MKNRGDNALCDSDDSNRGSECELENYLLALRAHNGHLEPEIGVVLTPEHDVCGLGDDPLLLTPRDRLGLYPQVRSGRLVGAWPGTRPPSGLKISPVGENEERRGERRWGGI